MVLTHDTDEAIQRAMIRATARNIQATQVDVAAVGYDRTVYYQVGASSHVGAHRVALHYTADGVTAVCDCEAGQSGRICHHVAAALRAEEMPQDPEGAPPAPVSDPAAAMRALAERLQHYWMREVGNWAEHDALLAKLCELRRRAETAAAAPRQIVTSRGDVLPADFISNIMDPGAF